MKRTMIQTLPANARAFSGDVRLDLRVCTGRSRAGAPVVCPVRTESAFGVSHEDPTDNPTDNPHAP